MGISMNGPSGIDTQSLIQQLTEMEMQKVYKIDAQKSAINKRIDAYSQFETYLSDISKAATKLDDREDFNMYSTSSSDEDTATVSTSFGAQPGSYGLKVYQLAEREKLISSDGLITNNQNDMGKTGKFKINGAEVTVEATDSLEELRVKINNAKKSDGTKIGVTATVLKMADNNFRLVLSSDDTGSAGSTYEDSEGSVLKDLGLVTKSATGNTYQSFESNTDMSAAWSAMADNDTVTISGMNKSGATVTSTYVKKATDTTAEFLKFVETAYGGNVAASFDGATGHLKVTDKLGGATTFSLTGVSVNSVDQGVTQTVTGTTDPVGNKGTTNETYESAGDMNALFAAPGTGGELAIGGKISITGTDMNGKAVTSTYVRGENDTATSFAKFVESAFNGGVTASYDATSGKMKVVDKNGGNSLFSVTGMSVESSSMAFSRTVTGYKSPNVLSVGRDAYFSVDSINISSTTNKATGIAKGVNFDLKAVGYEKTTTVSVTRDVSGLGKKVEELINAYNAVQRYTASSTKFVASDDKSGSSGVLVGDMTAKTLNSKVRGVFMDSFTINDNTTFTALSQLGIKTNTTSGQYELDRTKFESALNVNFEEVVKIFVNEGYTDNSNVVFGTKNKETTEGKYSLVEVNGEYKIKPLGADDSELVTGTRSGDIINFASGPANGLYLTAPASSGNATVTYSKGLAGRLTDIVNSLTAAETGTIASRKKSMQSQIKSFTTMSEAMTKRVTAYTDRLTKQFATMEQTMSTMKAQQSAMLSQLGYR